MSLSANTLIHFTGKKETLKEILQKNFKVFNCKETLILNGKKNSWHVPMVSFCDIPLSQIKDHISKYGNYGLGMTKEWGIKNRLNPVLYIEQHSFLAASYQNAFNHFTATNEDEDIDDWTNEQRSLADVLRYIKNYEADLIRQGKTIPNYRFSDEREWRYVPSHNEKCDMFSHTNWYKYADNKVASDKLLEKLSLEFEPNDIKYIIIDNDDEIAEFVDHLRRVKGNKYSLHDIERLTTRILTTEQIKSDI